MPRLAHDSSGLGQGHSFGTGYRNAPLQPALPAIAHPTPAVKPGCIQQGQPAEHPAGAADPGPDSSREARPQTKPSPRKQGLCFASRACRHSRNAAATKPTRSSGTEIPLRGPSRTNAPSTPASAPSRQARHKNSTPHLPLPCSRLRARCAGGLHVPGSLSGWSSPVRGGNAALLPTAPHTAPGTSAPGEAGAAGTSTPKQLSSAGHRSTQVILVMWRQSQGLNAAAGNKIISKLHQVLARKE